MMDLQEGIPFGSRVEGGIGTELGEGTLKVLGMFTSFSFLLSLLPPSLLFSFSFAVLGFELRVLHLLSRCSTT